MFRTIWEYVQRFFAIPFVKLIVWTIIGIVLVGLTAAGIFWFGSRVKAWEGIEPDILTHTIEAAALVVAAVQIVVIYGLSRSEAKWRKLLSYHEFFSDCPEKDYRQNMTAMMKANNFDGAFRGTGQALSNTARDAIYADATKLEVVKQYLDGFEQLAAAIQCRVVDEDYAFHNEGTRIVRAFKVFGPIIAKLQEKNPLAYIQFQELAENWRDKRAEAISKERERVKKIKVKLRGRRRTTRAD
jgi:hypothetical protein